MALAGLAGLFWPVSNRPYKSLVVIDAIYAELAVSPAFHCFLNFPPRSSAPVCRFCVDLKFWICAVVIWLDFFSSLLLRICGVSFVLLIYLIVAR
jgi:hypothetical protein